MRDKCACARVALATLAGIIACGAGIRARRERTARERHNVRTHPHRAHRPRGRRAAPRFHPGGARRRPRLPVRRDRHPLPAARWSSSKAASAPETSATHGQHREHPGSSRARLRGSREVHRVPRRHRRLRGHERGSTSPSSRAWSRPRDPPWLRAASPSVPGWRSSASRGADDDDPRLCRSPGRGTARHGPDRRL